MRQISHIFVLLNFVANSFASSSSHSAPYASVLNHTLRLRDRYDYIVIGGGASGLVVANRLTENPSITVLVIEYGYVYSTSSSLLFYLISSTNTLQRRSRERNNGARSSRPGQIPSHRH